MEQSDFERMFLTFRGYYNMLFRIPFGAHVTLPKTGGLISTNTLFGTPKYRTQYENELLFNHLRCIYKYVHMEGGQGDLAP